MRGRSVIEVIAVGFELLGEERTETNSLLLARYLSRLGLDIRRKVIVGDDSQSLTEAFEQARKTADVVILTGGLGPTEDDITREVVAEALGLHLEPDPALVDQLQSTYRKLNLELKPNSLRQAMVPSGATVLPNAHGTAPGLRIEDGPTEIFLLPGPPRELKPMVEQQLVPRLRKRFELEPLSTRTIRLASVAESAVDTRIQSILADFPHVRYTILSSLGLIETVFTASGPENEEGERMNHLQERICREFGEDVYATEPLELPAAVGRLLQKRGWTMATAESCTGGALSKWLTDQPGSSEYFRGGIVAYSNELKLKLLGVQSETLMNKGAVSAETATEMAEGVCRVSGSEVGISVTGIAGPDGGSPEKPVGTIWFGLSIDGKTATLGRQIPGDRQTVRTRAVNHSLDWLRRHLDS